MVRWRNDLKVAHVAVERTKKSGARPALDITHYFNVINGSSVSGSAYGSVILLFILTLLTGSLCLAVQTGV